jgi:YHS domain-containing protein
MRNLIALMVVAALIAGCGKPAKPTKTSREPVADKTVATAAAATAEQTICPVMDKPIDKQYKTEYKGKTVYFCCPACKPEFDKDPEKYIVKLPQFKKPK